MVSRAAAPSISRRWGVSYGLSKVVLIFGTEKTYCEQQLPKVDPEQVVVVPQVPSVLTANPLVGVEVGAEVAVAVPVGTVPPSARYQFACGSETQSPTVTPLYPLDFMEVRI